jgi:arylsulfatase A-like enzyme
MARQGARAERLIPVFPSNTFPGHVSLVTGTYPDRHGIVDNRFFDRERGVYDYESDADWIEAEPLWVTAERQGVRAAIYFWVGSTTDWRGRGASLRVAPFDPDLDEAPKVARMLEWLALPEGRRPGLILSWWHGADAAGHRNGPDAAAIGRSLAHQDRQLQVLLAALDARHAWDQTTLLVVSDHGMTVASERIPLRSTLERAGIGARLVLGSAVAHVFLEDPGQEPAASRVLRALPGVTLHRGPELPDSLRLRHPRRTGDLVALTSPPRTFREPDAATALWASVAGFFGGEFGLHGYAPDHPDMPGILYALGRGVEAGTSLGAVRMIDVAATVSRLLGIEPPAQSEGRPIAGIGDSTAGPPAAALLPLAPALGQDALAQP